MKRAWRRWSPIVMILACRAPASAPPELPPELLSGDSELSYPPALYHEGRSGTVALRLFVDTAGRVVPESTVVHRSSGHPAFDSAALAAAPRLRYAAARRNGAAVATTLLQEFHFRPPAVRDSP
jgi:TonB family protein